MKDIVKNLTESYEISQSKTHVGLVEYSGPANTRVLFKENYNKDQFKMSVDSQPRLTGGTLIEALKKVNRVTCVCSVCVNEQFRNV